MRLCCYWVFSFPVVNLIFAYQCFYYSGWHQCWSHMCKIGVGAHSTPSWVSTVTSLGAVSVMHCPRRLCHLWVFVFFQLKYETVTFFLYCHRYPVLETIQKYLWPRLCKLDQQTLWVTKAFASKCGFFYWFLWILANCTICMSCRNKSWQ